MKILELRLEKLDAEYAAASAEKPSDFDEKVALLKSQLDGAHAGYIKSSESLRIKFETEDKLHDEYRSKSLISRLFADKPSVTSYVSRTSQLNKLWFGFENQTRNICKQFSISNPHTRAVAIPPLNGHSILPPLPKNFIGVASYCTAFYEYDVYMSSTIIFVECVAVHKQRTIDQNRHKIKELIRDISRGQDYVELTNDQLELLNL